MEIKKSSKADLEKDISLNYLMGLVIALAVLFVGFELGESDIEIKLDSGIANIIEEEEIEATEQNEPPPPVVEPEKIVTPDIIEIVENTIEVEAVNLSSSEDDATHAQAEIYVPPVEVEEEEVDENYIFVSAEEPAEYPGGDAALLKWISDNINYPTIAQENGIQGRVSCRFVVEPDGSVSNVEVVRGVNPYLDREAVRALSKLPKFKPGKQRGKPVRVRYSVPVNFKLQN